MPRDENAIVGRKKTIEWCRLCCKEKAGFFIRQTLYISMTTRAIRFIYAANFFMLKDQNLSFEICCENNMTGKRNATGQVYSSMVLSYM